MAQTSIDGLDPRRQVVFLQRLQRLLSEGAFAATYKFALLHALADLAVESPDARGDRPTLKITDIADRFIGLYWRQALPYPAGDGARGGVLRQNSGDQAAIFGVIDDARRRLGDNLARARRAPEWATDVTPQVARILRSNPLQRLQTVGGETDDFLYTLAPRARSIALAPDAAWCLRAFHGLVLDLARGAWLRHIRRINTDLLGTRVELADFLFGSERADLSGYRDLLTDLQRSTCFYCEGRLRDEAGDVDHFIPWSLYPVDLGHNFVVAHKRCNRDKADRLAAVEHLERWCHRNATHGAALAVEFSHRGLPHDRDDSTRITTWAYERLEGMSGRVWQKGRQGLVDLAPHWRSVLGRAA